MSARWNAVNARARGLGTHLLRRSDLDALARAPDLSALAAELARLGFLRPEEGTGPVAFDLAVRRRAAAALATLARWCADRPDVVAVVFEDEDRRSLRAMVRGAAQNAAADARLAGLIPTSALPERALRELARQPAPSAVAALLVSWAHPYGSPLLDVTAGTQPDLFQLEVRLSHTFAERALAAARRGGQRLVTYVRELIDLENALAAMVLAEQGEDATPKEAFVHGGLRLAIGEFEQAAGTRSPLLAASNLARAFRGTVAAAFARRGQGGEPGRLERDILRARIGALRAAVRTDPLGPEPFLLYALRLRAQVLDLRRIVWGVALGAPRPELAAELASV
ncbi:MAG TPA: V-type ATPase subunit [Gemmatimonadales bacterium]